MRSTSSSRPPGLSALWAVAPPFAARPVGVGERASLLATLMLAGCFVSKSEVADWAESEAEQAPADGTLADGASADGAADGGSVDGGASADGAADGGSVDGGSDGGASNAAPSRPEITLVSSLPTTLDDLAVEIVTESIDPDGDPVVYRYAWSQDGAARSDLTGPVVSAAETSRGERWEVSVFASDGEAESTGAVASATVRNSTPTVESVSLSPTTVRTDDTLTTMVVGSDADDDALAYSYAWTVNGESRGGNTAAFSGLTYFSKGDEVRVTVTPNDGTVSGTGVLSSLVTVQNSTPTVSSVSLSPTTVRTNDTITASFTGSDADGDALTYTYAWTVNGAARGSSTSTLSGATYFSKGDVVRVTVTPNDGAVSGTAVSSSSVTVQNSTPSTPTVTVSPSSPRAGRALACSASSTDADGDPLTYSYSWTVDGVTHPGSSATVPLGETLPGEVWRCTATATDGAATSSAGSRSVTVGASSCNDGAVSLTASGIQFVTVCGGTFDMGCTPGQSSCGSDESPVRSTTLTRDYYISRTEVTQGQFSAVMGYNPSNFTACGSSCPVELVTWHESAAFANAVSAAAGLPSCYTCSGSGTTVSCTAPTDPYACTGYRLPTEAEWEGAARCGEDLLYAGSDVIDEVAWYFSSPGSTTFAVAGLSPNACGLYDMSGNVWEWVNDWYLSSAYSGGAATDPTGPASGSDRVIRGGSWLYDPRHARVAARGSSSPGYRDFVLGLRLLRTAP